MQEITHFFLFLIINSRELYGGLHILIHPTTMMRIYCLCLVFLLVFITATITSGSDRQRSSKLSASLRSPMKDNKRRKMQRKGGKSQRNKMKKKRTRIERKDEVDRGRKNAKDKKTNGNWTKRIKHGVTGQS